MTCLHHVVFGSMFRWTNAMRCPILLCLHKSMLLLPYYTLLNA